jgi:hypothetical protein
MIRGHTERLTDTRVQLFYWCVSLSREHIVTDPRKSGPLPLNGQLVIDVISAVTGTDSYPITRNGWAKHSIRGNRYAL